MSQIFISYSRKDTACVLKVARQLEAQGYKVWIDVDSIPGGEQWALEIQKGIRDAQVTLLFWSANSAGSDYVKQEYELALQRQMQAPNDKRLVIPVLLEPLDNNALPEELNSIQAVKLFNCSRPEINNLTRHFPSDLKQRQLMTLDHQEQLGDFPDAQSLKRLPNLVRVTCATSIHCQVNIVAERDTTLSDILTHPDPTVQVYLRFMFGINDEQPIEQIFEVIQELNTQREEDGMKPLPFYMIEITGPHDGTNYTLGDSPDGFWHGQWLDAVNTTFEIVDKLVGRGTLIQLFNAVPATLNFAIGMQFFKYWHLHLYHYTRDRRYQFVMDTDDL